MKIIFIYLPHPYLRQPDAQAPGGLLYLAAILEKQGIDVDVKNYSSFETNEAIEDLPEAGLYGITVTSLELLQANRFSSKIKSKYPNSKIILGGPGTYTDEFVDWTVIDSICKGDGEITILTIVKDAANNRLQSIYEGEYVTDIDSVPFPARHLLHDKQGGNIFAYGKNYKSGGSTIILSSRGCPYKCSFCSSPRFTLNNRVRFREPESVYQEIKHVIETYGIKQFRFSDDMFTLKKRRVLEICELLSSLDIVWRISCRAKPIDHEMFKAMYDAGCMEVSVGIESFDDNVLQILNKGITAEENARALEICKDIGIKTRVLFMIRTPGQTGDTVRINKEWIQRVPYDIIACTSFVPIPGSDIWENPGKYGIEILSRNLDDFNFYFFGKQGENELKDVIRIRGRSLDDFNQETQEFKEFLKSTGKLNRG